MPHAPRTKRTAPANKSGSFAVTVKYINSIKRTPEQITELARGMITGQEYVTNNAEALRLSFMPLMFMDIKRDAAELIGAVGAKMAEAGPRSVNGLPMFFSCYFVHRDDIEPLRAELKRMEEALGITRE